MSNINIVNAKTTTTNFQMTSGATNGYILTSDSLGNATWQTPTTFTGNTSGDCITDLYVSNIHSCSPLNINPLDEGNVYFGATSGLTIDVANSRLGIGTTTPTERLDVSGNTKISGSLNIGTILGNTPIINLGLDSSGNVVTGTTGGGTFTGNTSGDCITDLYVTNLYGCSPLHIEPSGLNDVYLVENGGNVGISNDNPQYTLDVTGEARISGSGQNILTIIGSGDTNPLFTIQGSSGELFSVTDSLVGSLFSVNDISGLPILEVFDNDTILMGNYQAPSLNTTVRLTPSTGLSTVYSVPMSAYTGAWFEYTVSNTGGARAGQIMSIFSGNTVNFTETTTTDIGSTSDITFSMSADSTNTLLQVSATTTGWEVKTIVRSI